MRTQTIFAGGVAALCGVAYGGSLTGLSAIASSATLNATSDASIPPPTHLAQVNNADSACYLRSPDGQEYDLSALCGGFRAASEVILQTGDVQVTLRWNTADDLDLFVQDPSGDRVSYANPSVPSGGLLDVDANAACAERMASPVENIFWPTHGGVPGNYVVSVDLFSHCGAEAPVDFTLTTLVQGQVQTQTGTVSASQTSGSFPFSFPSAPNSSAPNSSAPNSSASSTQTSAQNGR